MATDTWKVNSDGDWSTAADWSRGVIPQAGDSVVISTAQLHTITYDSASPRSASPALRSATTSLLLIIPEPPSRSRPRRASATCWRSRPASSISTRSAPPSPRSSRPGGTVSGSSELTVSGAATFSGSNYDEETGTGTTLLDGVTSDAGTIALDGGRVLENAGTFNVTGSAYFYLGHNFYGTTVGGTTIKNEARADVRLPDRVDDHQRHRHERVRERGHAGADGHHGDDQHRRRRSPTPARSR